MKTQFDSYYRQQLIKSAKLLRTHGLTTISHSHLLALSATNTIPNSTLLQLPKQTTHNKHHLGLSTLRSVTNLCNRHTVERFNNWRAYAPDVHSASYSRNYIENNFSSNSALVTTLNFLNLEPTDIFRQLTPYIYVDQTPTLTASYFAVRRDQAITTHSIDLYGLSFFLASRQSGFFTSIYDPISSYHNQLNPWMNPIGELLTSTIIWLITGEDLAYYFDNYGPLLKQKLQDHGHDPFALARTFYKGDPSPMFEALTDSVGDLGLAAALFTSRFTNAINCKYMLSLRQLEALLND